MTRPVVGLQWGAPNANQGRLCRCWFSWSYWAWCCFIALWNDSDQSTHGTALSFFYTSHHHPICLGLRFFLQSPSPFSPYIRTLLQQHRRAFNKAYLSMAQHVPARVRVHGSTFASHLYAQASTQSAITLIDQQMAYSPGHRQRLLLLGLLSKIQHMLKRHSSSVACTAGSPLGWNAGASHCWPAPVSWPPTLCGAGEGRQQLDSIWVRCSDTSNGPYWSKICDAWWTLKMAARQISKGRIQSRPTLVHLFKFSKKQLSLCKAFRLASSSSLSSAHAVPSTSADLHCWYQQALPETLLWHTIVGIAWVPHCWDQTWACPTDF